ncbi:MAG: tetratricopeptide repeat protein [Candidatus Eremiobacteraeota bacterium]|nr:tetratricopeptide repeat protein [Candidatus Eremiobacteraeota bacterium]
MVIQEPDWEQRVTACWNRIREEDPQPSEIVALIDALADERPPDDPAAMYERASARDSAGRETDAEPLYRAALSSPQLDESERLLRAELDRCAQNVDPDALPDETRAFFALTLVAQGKPVDAAMHALTALAPHLRRYSRSVTAYAAELVSTD